MIVSPPRRGELRASHVKIRKPTLVPFSRNDDESATFPFRHLPPPLHGPIPRRNTTTFQHLHSSQNKRRWTSARKKTTKKSLQPFLLVQHNFVCPRVFSSCLDFCTAQASMRSPSTFFSQQGRHHHHNTTTFATAITINPEQGRRRRRRCPS